MTTIDDTIDHAPPAALSSATRRDLILGLVKYQFCDNWRSQGKLVATLRGSIVESRDVGGSAGKVRLRELKRSKAIDYSWKWNSDRTDTVYTITPGASFDWDWIEKPHPERRAVSIPEDVKFVYSKDARRQMSFLG